MIHYTFFTDLFSSPHLVFSLILLLIWDKVWINIYHAVSMFVLLQIMIHVTGYQIRIPSCIQGENWK